MFQEIKISELIYSLRENPKMIKVGLCLMGLDDEKSVSQETLPDVSSYYHNHLISLARVFRNS